MFFFIFVSFAALSFHDLLCKYVFSVVIFVPVGSYGVMQRDLGISFESTDALYFFLTRFQKTPSAWRALAIL